MAGHLVKKRKTSKAFEMACNPDDTSNNDKDTIIRCLREENDELKRQIEQLSARLSLCEIETQQHASSGPSGPSGPYGSSAAASRQARQDTRYPSNASTASAAASGGVGRKSIPFFRRNAKQHQGRIAYLLKKLEKSKSSWSQDAIADLQEYFISSDIPGAGHNFFKLAVVAFAGENAIETITDIDTFIAMLQ